MWNASHELVLDGEGQKFAVTVDDRPLPYGEAISLWQTCSPFRMFFTNLLRDSQFKAFRWETPSVTSSTLDRAFEFVLLRSDALARPVDRTAFESHFDGEDVVTFPNLSGDATMVVPCPVASETIYGHLASFLRGAPESQIHSLWQSVSDAMRDRIGDRPVWLSTAGMGVSWLHVRLDSRPKYYGYRPYKSA